MKIKIVFLACGLILWGASPVLAQNNSKVTGRARGHGHGPTNKAGPNENASDKQRSDDNDNDGKSNVGEHRGSSTMVIAATAEVVSALKSGTLASVTGVSVPVSAQEKVFAVLTRKGVEETVVVGSASTNSAAKATKARLELNLALLSEPLSAAGPNSETTLPPLLRNLSGLAYNPDWLPVAVAEYNRFVQSASDSFLGNPPPEFVALHAVLAKLTSAAGAE